MMAAQLVNVTFPWNFLVFFVIFFPASIAYSIVRHNLFDADVIIKRTVGYVVVTAIVVGVYGVVSLSLNVFLGKYQLAQSRAFPILFTLGVILVFNPLRNRIQALVDRVFFRKEYDYGAIVEKIGGAMTSLLDLSQILRRLTQTFIEDMFINTGSVMLLSAAGTEYQVYLADGERKEDVQKVAIKRKSPLMESIEGEKRELTKYDVIEDPKFRAVSETCNANFEALHASLMVPLVFQDQVIGSLNLGEKKSGKSYTREDIELLRSLAHQGAVAIENARLFQENLEKQRMEEELNIARDLQMSMLPSTCPEIKGFKIAASSTPAREVGGDFYDFIEMGEGRAGMVIADVTGKSVSGALVMSSSRSVFRMLSEEELTVSESMMRANRRLKKDVKAGMFVALLFAVFNSLDRTLTLCSAGQTQPIHMSATTGMAALVDDSEYEETQLKLEPGDKVVLYTDGIVEAMNEQEEIFGFDRLVEVIQAAKAMSAEALLKDILDKVSEFAGGAAQHDDLTVIVVSVEQ
jgi:sigma-B regulation protein RsbU (phosphoserine phosphatase)